MIIFCSFRGQEFDATFFFTPWLDSKKSAAANGYMSFSTFAMKNATWKCGFGQI